MYAQIGDIILTSAYGFGGFTQESGRRIVQHDLINVKPMIDTTGLDLIKLTFTITLNRQFIIPEVEIKKFEQLVIDNKPVSILLGNGVTIGNFIIPSVKKTINATSSNGNIIDCSIELSAIEWAGEMPTSISNDKLAIAGNNIPVQSNVSLQKSQAGIIATNISECQSATAAIGSDLRAAEKPAVREKSFRRTLRNIQHIEKKLTDSYIILSNTLRLANEAAQLKTKITRAQQSLATLKSATQQRNLSGAQSTFTAFQGTMNNVGGFTAPFTKSYIIRRTV